MGIDLFQVFDAIDEVAAHIENVATLDQITKIGVSVYRRMRSLGIDPVFGSKALADAAIAGGEVAADVAEEAKLASEAAKGKKGQ